MHASPVKSDLRGVNAGSVVTSGNVFNACFQEVNAAVKRLTDNMSWKCAIKSKSTIIQNKKDGYLTIIVFLAIDWERIYCTSTTDQ